MKSIFCTPAVVLSFKDGRGVVSAAPAGASSSSSAGSETIPKPMPPAIERYVCVRVCGDGNVAFEGTFSHVWWTRVKHSVFKTSSKEGGGAMKKKEPKETESRKRKLTALEEIKEVREGWKQGGRVGGKG